MVTVPLETVAQVFNGKTPSKEEQRLSGCPVLKIKDVDDNGVFRGSFESYVDEEFYRKHKEKCVRPGDTLILNAAHNADYVGSKVYLVSNGVNGAIATGEWLIVRAKEEKLDYRFAHYWLTSEYGRQKIKGLVKGIHLYPRDVRRIAFPLPPLLIQKQIAAILEKADAAREKRRQANQLTEQFLQSAFLEMFGDPVMNPKGWEVKGLGEIAATEKFSIVDGPFGSHLKASEYTDSGVRVIRVNNIFPNEFNHEDIRYVSVEKYKTIKRSTVRPNDIVMAKVGNTIGKTCVFPNSIEFAVLTANVCKITIDKTTADTTFVSRQMNFNGIQLQIRKLSGDTAKPMINLPRLRQLRLITPPLLKQQEFTALVEKVESLRAKQKESEKELEKLFNSLMQRAFKGELVQ